MITQNADIIDLKMEDNGLGLIKQKESIWGWGWAQHHRMKVIQRKIHKGDKLMEAY